MTIQNPTTARRQRKSQRGAALVEAAVVIPVMLVFLGCIMFAHRSYDVKLDKQMGTRAGILYYGSHNCEGEMPPGVVPPINEVADPGTQYPDGTAPSAGQLGSENSGGAAAGINRSWNLAKATPADSNVYGSAVEDRKRVPLNRKIHAASEVACNEKAYPNKWTAVIGAVGGLARSGGGFKD